MSDGASIGNCSSSGCAMADGSPYITLKKSSTYHIKKSDYQVEVNGDCYVGPDALDNAISISVKPFTDRIQFRGLNVGDSSDGGIHCRQGKFNFILLVDGGIETSVIYSVSGQLNIGTLSAPSGNLTSAPKFTLNLSVSQ